MKRFLSAFSVALALATPAAAMQFRTVNIGGVTAVEMSGEIMPGDAARFFSFVKSVPQHISAITLNSPGGDPREAVIMGLAINRAAVVSIVPAGNRCNSACFYLFAAGTRRQAGAGAEIGVHSAAMTDGQENAQSALMTVAGARVLWRWGVPADIIGRIVETPASRGYFLTGADLREMNAVNGAEVIPARATPGLTLAGLSGRWESKTYPNTGGALRLTDFQLGSDGEVAGGTVFSGSPCGQNAAFAGKFTPAGMAVVMQLGACGQMVALLQPNGSDRWVGAYKMTGRVNDTGIFNLSRQ